MATRSDRAWVRRPTKQELADAVDKQVRDVIGPDLRVLFCGINPGLYSGAVGHHFARPGNRFWKVLHRAGLTERELSPFEERELLGSGIGITNLVRRTTASASELGRDELRRGAIRLGRKVQRYQPAIVAFVGHFAARPGIRFRRLAACGTLQLCRPRARPCGRPLAVTSRPSR